MYSGPCTDSPRALKYSCMECTGPSECFRVRGSSLQARIGNNVAWAWQSLAQWCLSAAQPCKLVCQQERGVQTQLNRNCSPDLHGLSQTACPAGAPSLLLLLQAHEQPARAACSRLAQDRLSPECTHCSQPAAWEQQSQRRGSGCQPGRAPISTAQHSTSGAGM